MDNPLSKVLAKAPPPPPLEVKIRTMRSDIDSMMKSGGGAPSFQNVPVSGLTMEGYKAPTTAPTPMPSVGSFSVPAAPAVAPTPIHTSAPATAGGNDIPPVQNGSSTSVSNPDPASDVPAFAPEPTSGNNLVPIIIVIIVAIGAIAVVGYFAYTIFK
jgi:hypothetical protein